MAYTLEAFIGSAEALHVAATRWPAAAVVPLADGLALVPMTDDLVNTHTDGATEQVLGFWRLPGGFEKELASWSSTGSVGYVEAEYFGGTGTQRAALWVEGELALGPLWQGEDETVGPQGSPISQLLARLGVKRDGYRDEFDAIGLGRHRATADWLP